MGIRSCLLLAVLAAVLGGCAQAPPSKDLVVLLPSKDGKVGKVFVQGPKGDTLLESPYAASRNASDGSIKQDTAKEQELAQVFGGTLAAMPPRPVSFTLYFVSGSDEFTEESKQEVQRMLAEMGRRAAPDIAVIGHTDRVGADLSNDALSLQRAERVKTILVGMGISAERIRTAGRGKREPLVPTADGVPEARNRRVEISVR